MAEKLPNEGDPTGEDFPKGPDVGEPVPEFILPDQRGNPVCYRPNGQHRALILFHRSADW